MSLRARVRNSERFWGYRGRSLLGVPCRKSWIESRLKGGWVGEYIQLVTKYYAEG